MSRYLEQLPQSWRSVLADEMAKDYFVELEKFVEEERSSHTIYPPAKEVFAAFQHTPYDEVKVFVVGQDPYHGPKQAHGLCFSVRPEVAIPPSLKNMYKELKDDIGCEIPDHGYLMHWADQGMLLLNTVLTVRAGEANSHKKKGWEKFTDEVIRKVNEREDPVVFVLWGGQAKKKKKLIDGDKHVIVESAHPSPLAARYGFFGSKPYSKINHALEKFGKEPIDWAIPPAV